MKKTYILIAILFCISIKLIAQENSSGIYFYSGKDHRIQINLKPDSSSTNTFYSFGQKTEPVSGNWIQRNDSITVFEYFPLQEGTIKDTLYFKIINSNSLSQFFPNKSFTYTFNKQIEYYENGNIKTEIKGYAYWPFTGIITTYFENGIINEITNYENGKKDGQFLEFNQQGILVITGQWIKDEPVGEWKYFDNTGFLTAVKNKNK